jgi:16S rRNA (cytidine1402-2'-O)-methyltransferase
VSAQTGRLVVVATPIGNLDDLSPRAAAALREAGLVACEDTRRTAVLLRHAGSGAPMVPAHEHNEARRAQDLVRRMREGLVVALVSDAGMPAVSDPGARVVAAAIAAGLAVEVIPGPGAVEAALVASGLAADRYAFVGFLPRKAQDLVRALERADAFGGPVVAFESPRRVPALLAALAGRDPDRAVAVCRELTKVHEEVLRGSAAALAERVREPVRGEVTVVIGPPAEAAGEADDGRLEAGLAVMLEAGMSPARAAEAVALLGAAPRNAAYRAALAAASRRAT